MTIANVAGKSVAIMSSKGGVGKTTISLGLAETIAIWSGFKVLLIDADPQGSLSSMMETGEVLPPANRPTLTSLINDALETSGDAFLDHVTSSLAKFGNSDLDEASKMSILQVGSGLIQLERQLTRNGREAEFAQAIAKLLEVFRGLFHLIVVDCSPGLYVSTEGWLRSCDYQISPIKADHISVNAMDVVFNFRRENKTEHLAKWLGAVVNIYQNNETERGVLEKISSFDDLRIFRTVVPATLALQRVTISRDLRSYYAKYPGASGEALRQLSDEVLSRIALSSRRRRPF